MSFQTHSDHEKSDIERRVAIDERVITSPAEFLDELVERPVPSAAPVPVYLRDGDIKRGVRFRNSFVLSQPDVIQMIMVEGDTDVERLRSLAIGALRVNDPKANLAYDSFYAAVYGFPVCCHRHRRWPVVSLFVAV